MRAAVARASSSPGRPVAGVRDAAFTTTACGWAVSRFLRETTTGAAWTRFWVRIAQPAGATERTSATSGFPDGLIPAATPEAGSPVGR